MSWRWYLAILMTCVLISAGGMFFALRERSVDCTMPQNCLVGKLLFYGAWRATD